MRSLILIYILYRNDISVKYFKTNMFSTADMPFSAKNMTDTLTSLYNNTYCEIIYLQQGTYLTDEHLERLGDLLVLKSTSIWCLYIDNAKYVSNRAWTIFINKLIDSKITHCYLSPANYQDPDGSSALTTDLIQRCKSIIRNNRRKHNHYSNIANGKMIKEQCTNLWWSPYKCICYEQMRLLKSKEIAALCNIPKSTTGTPRRTRGSSSIAAPNLKDWVFHCVPCGEQSNSSLPVDQHPSGHIFECVECKIWSHVGCVLPQSCLPLVSSTTPAVATLLSPNRNTNAMLDANNYDMTTIKYTIEDLHELDVNMLCYKCYDACMARSNNNRNDNTLSIKLPDLLENMGHSGSKPEPPPSVTSQQRSTSLANSFSETLSLKSPLYLSNNLNALSGSMSQYPNSTSTTNTCGGSGNETSGTSGNETDNTDGIDYHNTEIHPIRKKTRTESEILDVNESKSKKDPSPSHSPYNGLQHPKMLEHTQVFNNTSNIVQRNSDNYANDNFSSNSSASTNTSSPVSFTSDEVSNVYRKGTQSQYQNQTPSPSNSLPKTSPSKSNAKSPSVSIKMEKSKKDASVDENGNPTNGNNSNAQNASMMVRMRKRNNRGAAFTINTPVMVPALGCGGVITQEKNGGWKYVTFYKPVTTDASIIGKTVAAAALKMQNGGAATPAGPPVDANGNPLPPPPGGGDGLMNPSSSTPPNTTVNANVEAGSAATAGDATPNGDQITNSTNPVVSDVSTPNSSSATTNTTTSTTLVNGNPQVVIVGKWCRACDICEIGDDGVATGNTSKSYFSVKGHSGITGSNGQKLSLIHRYKHSNNTNPSKKKDKEKSPKIKPKSIKQLKLEQKLYSMNDGVCCSIDDDEVVNIDDDVDIDINTLHYIVSNGVDGYPYSDFSNHYNLSNSQSQLRDGEDSNDLHHLFESVDDECEPKGIGGGMNRARSATYANGTNYSDSASHLASLYGNEHAYQMSGRLDGSNMQTGKRRRSSIDILTDVDGEIFDSEFRNSVALKLLGSQLNVHKPIENVKKNTKKLNSISSKLNGRPNIMKSKNTNLDILLPVSSEMDQDLANEGSDGKAKMVANAITLKVSPINSASSIRSSSPDAHSMPKQLQLIHPPTCVGGKSDSIENHHTDTATNNGVTGNIQFHSQTPVASPSVPPLLFEAGHDDSDMEQFLRDLDNSSPLLLGMK